MTTTELLDQVKARHGLTSDYQLAKFMRWTPQQVSDYRNRRRSLGEDVALQVAAALDVDAGYVLAVTAGERAQSAAVRDAWQRVAERIGGALAAALLLWVAGGTLPGSDALAAAVGPWGLLIMSTAWTFSIPAAAWVIAWTFRPQLADVLRVGWETLKNPRGEPLI